MYCMSRCCLRYVIYDCVKLQIQELYDACDRMRPQLFRLASAATEDGDEGLGKIKSKSYKILTMSAVVLAIYTLYSLIF